MLAEPALRDKFSCIDLKDDRVVKRSETFKPDHMLALVHHMSFYMDTGRKEAFERSFQAAHIRFKKIGTPESFASSWFRYIQGMDRPSISHAARLANLDRWLDGATSSGFVVDGNSLDNAIVMIQRVLDFTDKKADWYQEGFILSGVFYMLDISWGGLTDDVVRKLLGTCTHSAKSVGVLNPRINRVCVAKVASLS